MIGTLRRLASDLIHDRRPLRLLPLAAVDTDLASPADAVRWLGPIDIGGTPREALFCHPRSSVSYDITVEPGDRIVTHAALLPDAWDRNNGGVTFDISIASPADGATRSASLTSHPRQRHGDRRWRSLSAAVPVTRPSRVRLTLATRVPDGAPADHAWAAWGDPAVVRRRPVAAVRAALRRAVATSVQRGPRAAVRELRASALVDPRLAAYRRWAATHVMDGPPPDALVDAARRFPYRPLISVITPVYNTDPQWLRACIASVLTQAYDHWELCLADDGSTRADTIAVLREQTDPRIKTTYLETNARISAASNAALALASGEFIALLDHDDELTSDALHRAVAHLNHARDADVLYSDEDKRDADGGLSEPFFKPCWSPEHLLSAMYTCHLTVARKSIVDRVGGFRVGYEGAQDHDLTLRMSEVTSRIHHVPGILYHWRRTPQSTASAGSAKPWADDAGKRALEDYLRRKGLDGDVLSGGVPGLYRVRFAIGGTPLVSIVADGGTAEHLQHVRARTRYQHVEIVSSTGDARGEHLLFLDPGLEPLDDEWLTAMLEYSQQDAIGAVGARLSYRDGRLRHVGVVTCLDGGPAAIFDGHAADSYGYFSSAIGVRNYAAVSGECLMTRRSVFTRLGGFTDRLPRFGADVDYCARVRLAGLRVVFTPYARLQYSGTPPERQWLTTGDDPYYHRSLSRGSAYHIDG
jgi:O-antigen biosynthesis protein